MSLYEHVFTTTASGAHAGTTIPLHGRLVSVRIPNAGTTWAGGPGTADVSLTRRVDGGTLLSAANLTVPLEYNPSLPAHTSAGGTTAYNLGVGPVYSRGIPVDGEVVVSVAQAQASQAGTLYLYVEPN